jgi:hypothetical protein
MRTRFTQNLGRFQNWVMAALPPCQKARMQKAKMAAAALSTRDALGAARHHACLRRGWFCS